MDSVVWGINGYMQGLVLMVLACEDLLFFRQQQQQCVYVEKVSRVFTAGRESRE